MRATGFSCPSTVPCWKAVSASPQFKLTGLAPSARKISSEDRHPNHTDFQAFEILWPVDRTLRVRQLAEPVLSPGERNDALLLDQLEQALPRLARLYEIQSRVARE